MRLNEFIAGLAILSPYFTDPKGHHISAEQDQFDVYATDRPVSAEDVAELFELGWFQNIDEDADVPAYDPRTGWSACT